MDLPAPPLASETSDSLVLEISLGSGDIMKVVKARLADIFRMDWTGWRADGHKGVIWLTQEFHKRAGLLKKVAGVSGNTDREAPYDSTTGTAGYDELRRNFLPSDSPLIQESKSLSTQERAALDCAAIVKVHTWLAEISGANSSQLLFDNERLIQLFQMYCERIATQLWGLDAVEIVPLIWVLDSLSKIMNWSNPRRVQNPPIMRNLAEPLRTPMWSVQRVAATGRVWHLVDQDADAATDAFITAHRPE